MEIGGIADYAYSNGDITRIISGTASVASSRERVALSRPWWDTRAAIIDILFSSLLDKSYNNGVIIFSRGVLSDEGNYANN